MKVHLSKLFLFIFLSCFLSSKSQTVTLLSEDFSSNNYSANGWTFPNGQAPWTVSNFYTPTVAVVPNAICFTFSVAATNYFIPMVSTTLNATSITGPVFFSCAIRLQNSNSNATGLEQLDLEYKNIGSATWSTISTYSNTLPGNNHNFSVNNFILTGMSGQNFQIRFVARGVNSQHMSGWGIDNILVTGVTCPSSLPSLTITSTPTLCAGSSATLTAIGGGPTFTWTPLGNQTSSVVVSPTVTSAYALLSSYPGCPTSPVSAIVTVTVLNNPTTLVVTSSSSTVCSGTSLTLTTNGSSSYTWNPGIAGSSITITPSVSTVYTVTATNSISCINTETINITVNPTPTVSIFSSTNTICSGATANLIASGAPTFSWNTGGSSAVYPVSPVLTTTYIATGSSSLGCSSSESLILYVSPTVVAVPSSSSICIGNTATLTASAGVTYTWNGTVQSSSITVNPTSNSVYSISATNTMGCISTQTLALIVNQNPTVTASSSSSAICVGNSASLTVAGASTYSWNTTGTNSTIIVSPLASALYTVTGTSAEGCSGVSSTAILSLIVNSNPTVNASAVPSVLCEGDSSILMASGASSYSWNTGALNSTLIANPLLVTIYTVTGTDANACSQTATVQVNVNANPTITIVASATNVCSGASVTLLGGGASTYTWNSSSNQNLLSLIALANSSHTLSGTALNGCMATKTINIVANPNPTIIASSSTSIICVGEPVTLFVSGAATYSWSTGNFKDTIVVFPLKDSIFSVEGFTSNGCKGSASILQEVDDCTGFNKLTYTNAIKIYPNPSNGIFKVEGLPLNQEISITVTDFSSRIIISKQDFKNDSEIDLREFPKGIYFMTLSNQGRYETYKLIKD